jgi:hypothetical protein
MAVLVGILGLALDLGQLFIIRSEAQSYTDMTALRAARELDGSIDGLFRARDAVAKTPMRWAMNTQVFTGTTVEFSRDSRAWTDQPPAASGVRYVRVTATIGNVEMFFLPAVVPERTAKVRTQSVAAQQPVTAFSSRGPGLLPFAPRARNLTEPDFGFSTGERITLREGDGPGYIQGIQPEAIRDAIEGDLVNVPVILGQPVTMTGGALGLQAQSLRNRVNQDTNATAPTYDDYRRNPGNGRRVALIPVIHPTDSKVLGFAWVFLPASPEDGRLIAEYIGTQPAEVAPKSTGGLLAQLSRPAGPYLVRLVQ